MAGENGDLKQARQLTVGERSLMGSSTGVDAGWQDCFQQFQATSQTLLNGSVRY